MLTLPLLVAALPPVPQIDFSRAVRLSSEVPGLIDASPCDFDGDGLIDLVVVSRSTPEIVLLPAVASGEYGRARTLVDLRDLGLGDTAGEGVDTGDVTGDGRPDVLFGGTGVDPLLFAQTSGGTLAPPRIVSGAGGGTHQRLLELSDVDGDGDLDLLLPTLGFLNGATYVENLGGGTLAPPLRIDSSLTALVSSDVESDGDPDFLAADGGSRLLLYRNDGNLNALVPVVLDTVGARVGRLLARDLDGDGREDLVIASSGNESVRVYRNAGGTIFDPPVQLGPPEPGLPPEVATVDVDGDGDLDVVFGSETGTTSWIENLGGLTFGAPQELTSTPTRSDGLVETADVDGDGRDDLVLAARDAGAVWLRGVPGGFETRPRPITAGIGGAVGLLAEDFDLDGDPDLVLGNADGGLSVVWNRGPGRLDLPRAAAPGVAVPTDLAATDVDLDGDPDVVVLKAGGELAWSEVDGLQFGPPQPIATLPPSAAFVRAEDVDQDGDDDILVARSDGEVLVVELTAPSTYAAPRIATAAVSSLTDIEVADLDADGVADLAVSAVVAGPGRRTAWAAGLGDGTFSPWSVLDGTGDATGIDLEDVDGDGRIDLTFTSAGPRVLGWVENLSPGSFALPVLQAAFQGTPGDVDLAPLDGNAGIDALVPLIQAQGRGVLVAATGTSGGPLVGERELARFVSEVGSIVSADLDGDGDLDVVVSTAAPSELFYLENRTVSEVGVSYCGPSVTNSIGRSASILAFGTPRAVSGDLELIALDLPSGATCVFLAAPSSGLVPQPPGSVGTLCLGSSIGRYVGAGQFGAADAGGTLRRTFSLAVIPGPAGPVVPAPGDLWYFQAWYRDVTTTGVASNFTDGVAIRLE